GLWRACTEEELAKYGKKPLTLEKDTTSPSLIDIINKAFEQYGGVFLTALILLIIGFGGYLFWKFYSEAKKPKEENQ
ncbi:MAG: hypothetical protein N3D10_02005, partial [Candidatus Micrarchaeota archaeon]|nr:hypothetical protein [Candidatus Micrarchaeota archaeon]